MTSRYPVNYPYIRSVAYEIDDSTLEVEFEEGSIYHYFNVQEELYWKFREGSGGFSTKRVKSSRIKEIGYDADMEIVLVELTSGENFLYLGIAEDTYDRFANSSSFGSFLNSTLKYAGYRHRKVGRAAKVDSTSRYETHPQVIPNKATAEHAIDNTPPLEKPVIQPRINRRPISYSHITSVGYDSENETMEVEFSGGAVYQYYHVPEEYHEQLVKTDSNGSDVFRERVESSEIRSIGYDAKLQILHVGFHNKSVCLYFGIPESIYKNFMLAGSSSPYLNQTVKWSGFRYHLLSKENNAAENINDTVGDLHESDSDVFEPIEEDDYYYEVGCHGAAYEADSHYESGCRFLSGIDCIQDFNKARIHFKISADHGHRGALFGLGEMYMSGTGVAQSFRQAAKWYLLGCGVSSLCVNYNANVYEIWEKVIHKLAYMYMDGIGVPQSYQEAMRWFLLSAELKNNDAQLQIGNMYFNGQGCPQYYVTARRWYLQAAGKGNVRAQCMLGSIYKHGAGVEKDYEKSLRWFQCAGENGDADAQYNIGCMCIKGEGIEADGQKAFEWFSKAAEQGNTDAQKAMAAVGIMYFYGKDVIEDCYEAAKWLRKAVETYAPINADFRDKTNLYEDPFYIDPKNDYRSKAHKGDAEAQTNLGLLYINGHGHLFREYHAAGTWYIEAIERGLLDLESPMFVIVDGTGTANKNAAEAFKWFTLAAKQENSNAQYQLGKLYHTGDGVEQNHKEAFYWYKKAAEHGHAEADLVVRQERQDADYQQGKLYYTGNGVKQSYEEALIWYKKAAEGGHAEAQNALGGAYANGDVTPDYSLALHWFSKAAAQGHKRALFNLGVLYLDGKCIEPDIIKSMAYYTAAERQGHVGAKEMMDEMRKNQILTSEQFQQVDFAASELLINVSAKGNT